MQFMFVLNIRKFTSFFSPQPQAFTNTCDGFLPKLLIISSLTCTNFKNEFLKDATIIVNHKFIRNIYEVS